VAQKFETTLPPFGQDGDLPSGVCRTTLRDTVDRFGNGSRQRIAVAPGRRRCIPANGDTFDMARLLWEKSGRELKEGKQQVAGSYDEVQKYPDMKTRQDGVGC